MHKIISLSRSACIHWIRSVCVNINISVIRSVCIKIERSAIKSVRINIIEKIIRIVLIFWIQTEILVISFGHKFGHIWSCLVIFGQWSYMLISLIIFSLINFRHQFLEKFAIWFSEKKKRGVGLGGQRPFGNFSKNLWFLGRQASLWRSVITSVFIN